MCEPYAAGYASPATTNTTVPQKSHQQQLNYQIPASALYEAPETDRSCEKTCVIKRVEEINKTKVTNLAFLLLLEMS